MSEPITFDSIEEFKEYIVPIVEKFYPGVSMKFTTIHPSLTPEPHYLVEFQPSGFQKEFCLRHRGSDNAWLCSFGSFEPYSIVPVLSVEDSFFNLLNRLADSKHRQIRRLEAELELEKVSLEKYLNEATRIGNLL